MFNEINDIFKYKIYYEHFILTKPYKFTINDNKVIIWFTMSYCYDLTLGISCDKIFYYQLVDYINNFTITDNFNLNLSINDANINFGLNITYNNNKLSFYLITTTKSNSESIKYLLSHLPIQINILSIDSKTYCLHIEDFKNLPTTLELLKIRNNNQIIKNFTEKLPFGCKIELSDDFFI